MPPRVMGTLAIQIQRSWDDAAVSGAILSVSKDFRIRDFAIQRGRDRGPYVNLLVKVKSPPVVWRRLGPKLNKIRNFRASAIVSCTGNKGWSDYILLQHYNGESDLVRRNKRSDPMKGRKHL